MKRMRSLCLMALTILVTTSLTIGLAATAQAAGGPLTPGVPVVSDVAIAGQINDYTFAGTAGDHVTVDVSASTWINGLSSGEASLMLVDQGGVVRDSVNLGQVPTFVDMTLASTGTWTVRVDPYGAATGSATFTLANDVPSVALSGGAPVATTIAFRGQNAGYTFAGTAGQHVSLDVSASTWINGLSSGEASLMLVDQGGVVRDSVNLGQGPTFVDMTLASTGTWRVRLDPYGAATGTATFTYANGATSMATALTARAPATSVAYGATATLSGTLKLANGAALVGTFVAVQSQAGTKWTTVATVSTRAGGIWTAAVRPGANRSYRAVFAGSAGTLTSTSRPVIVTVRPSISLKLSASKVRLGRTVTFSGTVAPSHTGRLVSLQRLHHGKWVTKKSVKLNKKSKYSITWKVTSRADYTWRVVLAKHSDHAAGASRQLKLTVR